MIKTLEAYCKAKGYQGATIWMIFEECGSNAPGINRQCDPYKWGYREGLKQRHGTFLGAYPVPVNSWQSTDNHMFTLAYIAGVDDGLMDSLDPEKI